MRNIDKIQIGQLLESDQYAMTIEDFEKVVAYRQEFEKYLQTFRLSLIMDKIEARWQNEVTLGNQIDLLEIIMKDLQENVEWVCKRAQETKKKTK